MGQVHLGLCVILEIIKIQNYFFDKTLEVIFSKLDISLEFSGGNCGFGLEPDLCQTLKNQTKNTEDRDQGVEGNNLRAILKNY